MTKTAKKWAQKLGNYSEAQQWFTMVLKKTEVSWIKKFDSKKMENNLRILILTFSEHTGSSEPT